MRESDFISFENLNKKFGKHTVINNLDLNIPFEGVFGIMGLSGCGKTTLLNMLIGFWHPDKGRVLYNAIDIHRNKQIISQLFGFATQDGSVYPKLTVEENLHYFGKLYNMRGSDIEKRMDEILDFVDLKDSRNEIAGELSTGMYRRLDIACSMIHNPKVLLLDEPTGNLDPVLRKKLMALIKKISDEGTKVIITSHLLGEVEHICDTLAILHNGNIVEMGSPEELKDKYTTDQVIRFETKKKDYTKIIATLKRSGVKKIFQKDKDIYLYTKDADRILSQILNFVLVNKDEVINVEVSKPSIEEVFEAVTR
ncbi:ABC transporter ATP-binding protein [archaeon]|nr:ABC transporter ATP-binding protein [archaeon]MBT3731147.1 ABC transporter ATP-binding protein [archaeon]MBT4670099.1 ABC transporter ATP-binding protein [archaeon]MBT5030601.1 ABC transporter ATP-binding protein [archaeon]MBT5287953.1 ABC transporter ATP-binding protein [archaeon]